MGMILFVLFVRILRQCGTVVILTGQGKRVTRSAKSRPDGVNSVENGSHAALSLKKFEKRTGRYHPLVTMKPIWGMSEQ